MNKDTTLSLVLVSKVNFNMWPRRKKKRMLKDSSESWTMRRENWKSTLNTMWIRPLLWKDKSPMPKNNANHNSRQIKPNKPKRNKSPKGVPKMFLTNKINWKTLKLTNIVNQTVVPSWKPNTLKPILKDSNFWRESPKTTSLFECKFNQTNKKNSPIKSTNILAWLFCLLNNKKDRP